MAVSELRGVWLTNVDSEVLLNGDKLAEALNQLELLNFNVLYPTVWQGGYTLYRSKVTNLYYGKEQHPEPSLAGRNPLAEIIKHKKESKQNFAIIPWFEFGLMAPENSELANTLSGWLTSAKGNLKVRPGDGEKRVWLNPLRPEVQQFIEELLVEIVTEHDVDGIQLDDHFGMPVEFGYDDFTVKLYADEHSGKRPPDDYNDSKWKIWRASKITEFMNRIFKAIKSKKTNCIISLSPNPKAHSFDNYLQDWSYWERKGFIEELVLQVYRNESEMLHFLEELDKDEVRNKARNHIPTSIGIMTGKKSEPTFSTDLIRQQVEEVRLRQFSGVSFFFYESLWNKFVQETEAERKQAFQKLFPTPTVHPNLYGNWLPPP